MRCHPYCWLLGVVEELERYSALALECTAIGYGNVLFCFTRVVFSNSFCEHYYFKKFLYENSLSSFEKLVLQKLFEETIL
jgi:hypothetical protein